MLAKFEEYISYIESEHLSALINLASGFKMFEKACSQDVLVKEFVSSIYDQKSNPELLRWETIQRISELSQSPIDERYRNPNDVAIAVYLWALSLVKLDTAETAAKIAINAPNCWWAKKVSSHILSMELVKNKGKTAVYGKVKNPKKDDIDYRENVQNWPAALSKRPTKSANNIVCEFSALGLHPGLQYIKPTKHKKQSQQINPSVWNKARVDK